MNPEKRIVMCSTTLEFAESGLQRPIFRIDGKQIAYEDSNKYLGFWMTSTLSSDMHVKKLLTGLRKSILAFKSSCKIKKKALLLAIARTYIVPVMHNLEFVGRITAAQNQRFDYLLKRFFNFRNDRDYLAFKSKHRFLQLKHLHKISRDRYHHDF